MDIFLGRYLFTVPKGIFKIFGLIPEWRGRYSHKWLKTNLGKAYSAVYAFVYSVECIRFADWLSNVLGVPLLVMWQIILLNFNLIELLQF